MDKKDKQWKMMKPLFELPALGRGMEADAPAQKYGAANMRGGAELRKKKEIDAFSGTDFKLSS